MKWNDDAEKALGRVPFFVRRRVRARVESETAAAGRATVTLEDVEAARKRFLQGMAQEVRGFQIEACFGPGGCPNRIAESGGLAERIRGLLDGEDILVFLRSTVQGELRFHHEFRVGIADCPNACSQAQVKDVGILGACFPGTTLEACTACGACEDACTEGAIRSAAGGGPPELLSARCAACGKCIEACPSGTLVPEQRGYRVQLGGRLGRHPRLGIELPGIHSEDRVVDIVRDCVRFYKRHSRGGRRFAHLLEDRHVRSYIETGAFGD